MQLEIQDLRKGPKTVEIEGTVLDMLKAIGEGDQTVLVSVNGKIVTSDHKLDKGDRVTVIPVVSGG